MYGNEKGVGKGIKIVDRKDVYITTKLKNDDHARVAEAVQESLQRLDTDYLDTYVVISLPISTSNIVIIKFPLRPSSMSPSGQTL